MIKQIIMSKKCSYDYICDKFDRVLDYEFDYFEETGEVGINYFWIGWC